MKYILFVLLLLGFNSCNSKQKQNNASVGTRSTAENNKKLIKRVYDEIVIKQNYSFIDSFYANNIFDHGAFEGQEQSFAGFKKAVSEFLGLFSRVSIHIDEMLAEGDLVSTRETWKVTRSSDQKELTGDTMHWFRIKDGKVTEEWSKGWEWLGL